MKQLRFSLNSSARRRSSNGPLRVENGIKKSNSKPKIYRFSFVLNNSIFSRRKWFMGEIRWLKRATRKNSLYSGTFQESIGFILALAQCFAIMPVIGVKSKSAQSLHFKWYSFRTLYSLIVFIMTSIYAGMALMTTFQNEIHFEQLIPLIFYGSAVYGMLCFAILATKWPKLMRRWELVEAKMPKYRTQKEKKKLAYNIKMLAFIVLMSSLVEHSLSMISIVHYSKTCLRQKNPLKELMKVQLSALFVFVSYSPLMAIFGKFVNITATFIWNYMDLFVMIMSLGLSSRFKQINKDLQRIKGEHMTEDFWALRRMQYRKLSGLCILIDDAISQITFLSFSNNLFFICVQLLKSIRPMRSVPHAVYFWFSLIFLISRTLAVSLYSSEIHDESKRPLEVLRAIPTDSWYIEVRRFFEEVVNDKVALSGMRFFFLTRKFILSVAGTIITYELVLIQFHKDDTSRVEFCSDN